MKNCTKLEGCKKGL